MSGPTLVHDFPDAATYLTLRAAAGLSPFSVAAAEIGLRRTIFGVSIHQDDAVIGMGRIIGDGGCFFQVVDIAVDPAHQGKGLGRMVMDALTDHIDNALPPGAYVSLIADRPADALYEKVGFAPTAPDSIGMARRAGPR